MTRLKLFYRIGAPAALLLGLIVGAPDIAHAFTQLPSSGGVGLESAPTYVPPTTPYIPPPATQVPNLTPRAQVPAGPPLSTPLPTPRTSSQTPATQPNPGGPDPGGGLAREGIGDGGAGKESAGKENEGQEGNGGAGADLTHAGDDGDTSGD